LEEVALLRIVQKSPTATQKEIAAEIGKSERTVKSIVLVSLSNKMEFCAILQQWPSGVSEGDFSQW
jgi:DNA-binding CsgD family transcriptional regulator